MLHTLAWESGQHLIAAPLLRARQLAQAEGRDLTWYQQILRPGPSPISLTDNAQHLVHTTVVTRDPALAGMLDQLWADLHAPAPREAGISVWSPVDLPEAIHVPLLWAYIPDAYEAALAPARECVFA